MNESIPSGSGMLLVTTDDPRSRKLTQFSDALAVRLPELSPARRHEPGDKAPRIVLPGGIRWVGVPEGHEAKPFMDILTGKALPPQPVVESTVGLRVPPEVDLFVSPRCTFCPGAVRGVSALARNRPLFRLTIIDAEFFPELAERARVKALPTLVIDGHLRWSGTIDPAEVARVLTAQDPAAIGPVALEMMLKEGRAREVAGMMVETGRVMPALVDLLVHPDWPVRLGAMVTAEELASRDAALAHQLLDRAWARFAAAPDAAKGDVLYLVGESGRPADVERIRAMVDEDAPAEVCEAAEEAIEKLMRKF
jgi:hypothetical protein